MKLMDKRLILEVVVLTTFIAIGTAALVSNPMTFGVASAELVFKNQNSLDSSDAAYNSNTSQSLGSKNISLTPYRMTEGHYFEYGILKTVGNITNNQIFSNTYLSDDLLVGRGNGTIETSDGQKNTSSSSDLGTLRDNQWVFYGVMLLNNTSSKSLSILNNSIALSKSSYPLMEPEYIWILEKQQSLSLLQQYQSWHRFFL
jgi:hypothetical protein